MTQRIVPHAEQARERRVEACSAGSPGFNRARTRSKRKQLKPFTPAADIGGKQDARSVSSHGQVWPR